MWLVQTRETKLLQLLLVNDHLGNPAAHYLLIGQWIVLVLRTHGLVDHLPRHILFRIEAQHLSVETSLLKFHGFLHSIFLG